MAVVGTDSTDIREKTCLNIAPHFFIDTYIDFLRVRLPTLKACDIYVYQLKYVYEVKCWIFTLKRGEWKKKPFIYVNSPLAK